MKTAAQWRALSLKFISKYGRVSPATATRSVASGDYVPADLAQPEGSADVYEIYCVPLDYAGVRLNAESEKLQFNDAQAAKELYVPAGIGPDNKTYVPVVGDIITLDKDWRVLAVKDTFEYQSVECAYLLHIGA